MIPGVNKIDWNSMWSKRLASIAYPIELGDLGGALWAPSPTPTPSEGPRGQSPIRKCLGSKTPLDWPKIGLNLTEKNYTYVFVNTPKKLIWEPPYKFLQSRGHGLGNSGALVITLLKSVLIVHTNTSSPDV